MAIDVDDVLEHLGHFGKYQKVLFTLSCITAVFCAEPVVILTFAAYIPPYRQVLYYTSKSSIN